MSTRAAAVVALLVVHGVPPAAAQVPPALHGDWVRAAAGCGDPARVRVEAARITLVNGADTQTFGDVEMAGPGYFPPGYRGIEAVAIVEFSGDQPVTATFNAGEKRGVARVAFTPPTADAPGNAVLNALNARLRALDLGRRFPLHETALRRCPAR